jgi:hypothetical protein
MGIQSHKPDDSHSLTGASNFYRNQRAILDWCVFVKGPPSVLPMWARSLRFCFVTLCAIVERFRATEPRPCHNRIGITVGHWSRQTVTVNGRAPEYYLHCRESDSDRARDGVTVDAGSAMSL